MSWSTWFPMNQQSLNSVPQRGGVYQLNAGGETLYVGQSDDLRRRLGEHLNSSDSCIRRATQFCYQESNDPEGLESRILKSFSDKNGGRLPPCNNQAS